MSQPQIIVPDYQGYHNGNPNTGKRVVKSKQYQDLSTICIIPSPDGWIHTKVAQNIMGILPPMNQKFIRIFVNNMEVGDAYSQTIDMILGNPDLAAFRYILFWEWDNLAPPDGLLKLYESIEDYAAVGGLYFCKGEMGAPMCYGKPDVFPVNFIPFMPEQNTVTECRGIGMGFSLFKMEVFKSGKLPKPFFKTQQGYEEGKGASSFTQDLWFCNNAQQQGFRFAVDARVKVGHMDLDSEFVW